MRSYLCAPHVHIGQTLTEGVHLHIESAVEARRIWAHGAMGRQLDGYSLQPQERVGMEGYLRGAQRGS